MPARELRSRAARVASIISVTFDNSSDVERPSLIELPNGTLTAHAAGLGATLDVHDFSLDKLRFAVAQQPATVQ